MKASAYVKAKNNTDRGFFISCIAAWVAFRLVWMNLAKDRITGPNYPLEFFCDSGENRIDFQTDGNQM